MKKLIILDRDGVINEDSDNYIRSLEEWLPIAGSIEAIAKLSIAGYLIAIATNQAGLAKGLFNEADLNAMHAKMIELVELSGGTITTIRYCPHHPNENCGCRKPRPGMLISILEDLNVKPEDSWFIGDNLKDIQAGERAGSKTALVKTGKGTATLAKGEGLANSQVFKDLFEFSEHILASDF